MANGWPTDVQPMANGWLRVLKNVLTVLTDVLTMLKHVLTDVLTDWLTKRLTDLLTNVLKVNAASFLSKNSNRV